MIYDDVIMRTIIDLPEVQVKALAELCRKKGISRAEAVRRALAGMLGNESENAREKAFGAWKKKKIDSPKFVEKLRGEWGK
jgi:metal-responsive CopG/Arc/MetJ family transcriptional regulator